MPPNGKRRREHVLELLERVRHAEVLLERRQRRSDLRLQRVDFDFLRARRAHPERRVLRGPPVKLLPRSGGKREEVRRQRIGLAEVIRRRGRCVLSTRSVDAVRERAPLGGMVSVNVSRALRSG